MYLDYDQLIVWWLLLTAARMWRLV